MTLLQHSGTRKTSTMCLRWTKQGTTIVRYKMQLGTGAVAKISFSLQRPSVTSSYVEPVVVLVEWKLLLLFILFLRVLITLPPPPPPFQPPLHLRRWWVVDLSHCCLCCWLPGSGSIFTNWLHLLSLTSCGKQLSVLCIHLFGINCKTSLLNF